MQGFFCHRSKVQGFNVSFLAQEAVFRMRIYDKMVIFGRSDTKFGAKSAVTR